MGRWGRGVKANLGYIHRGHYPPVYETGSTVQAAFVDEADALFKMLRSGKK